jgi:hypothetical protein
MCTGENDDFCPEVPDEPAEAAPAQAVESPEETYLHRRKFLKAAAIGTAAAAFINKGASFGPLGAYADVVTGVNCTANDVRISGPGIIVGEPCDCTGTFDAEVHFTVINGTGTDRYCVTVHLCAGTTSTGVIVPARDIVIGTVGPGSHEVTAIIEDYPCGAGSVCFGAAGSGEDGGFAKGEKCPTGQCCTIISWNVRPNDPCPLAHADIIKSKCRAQQVCIVGRGGSTLDCDTSATGVQTDCAVACGSTTTLRLCTTSPASFGPFTFTLGGQSFGPTTDTCHDFTVGPIAEDTCFTGTVTDNTNCAKPSNEVCLTVGAITPDLHMAGGSNCDGLLTFSTTVEGFEGCTLAYTIDEVDAADTESDTLIVRVNDDGTLTYRNLDGECHAIGVTATCGGCNGSASTSVTQCVTTTQPC